MLTQVPFYRYKRKLKITGSVRTITRTAYCCITREYNRAFYVWQYFYFVSPHFFLPRICNPACREIHAYSFISLSLCSLFQFPWTFRRERSFYLHPWMLWLSLLEESWNYEWMLWRLYVRFVVRPTTRTRATVAFDFCTFYRKPVRSLLLSRHPALVETRRAISYELQTTEFLLMTKGDGLRQIN